MDYLGEGFLIKFKLYIKSWQSGYRSVLLLTESSRPYGDSIPGVWLYGSSLHVAMEINGVWNVHKNIPWKLIAGAWVDIELRQFRKDGDVRIEHRRTDLLILFFKVRI